MALKQGRGQPPTGPYRRIEQGPETSRGNDGVPWVAAAMPAARRTESHPRGQRLTPPPATRPAHAAAAATDTSPIDSIPAVNRLSCPDLAFSRSATDWATAAG